MKLEAQTRSPPEGHFTAFAFFLAVFVLSHNFVLAEWSLGSFHVAASVAAMWTALRPSSRPRLLALAVLWVLSVVREAPVLQNHTLVFFVIFTLVPVALVVLASRGRSLRVVSLYEMMAPAARVALVLVYLFAALAKMNESFLDPDVSSAVAFYGQLVRRLPLVPYWAWLETPVLIGTIVLELGLPAMLLWRRSRAAAFLLGLVFHTALAAIGHAPFTAAAVVLYWAFVPSDLPEWFQSWTDAEGWRRGMSRGLRMVGRHPVIPLGLSVVFFLVALNEGNSVGSSIVRFAKATLTVGFMVYMVGLLVILVAYLGARGWVWAAPVG
ncbi:MAG: HTTM domain-containing protein, partial [Acidimicrobiia bacterium]|nr:HTTM domain-containing protein [Acidimicrobiia bacterium]